MKFLRHRWRLVLAVGIILTLVLGVNPWTLPLAARWLDVGGPAQEADAVVLLNGGYNSRPFVAAALVHGGWAKKILVNTVALHPGEGEMYPTSLEINYKVLKYGDVKPNCVEPLPSAAKTTFDEARGVLQYLIRHPEIRRLMIVTEGPHTRRSRWIFQRVLAERSVKTEIAMISAPAEDFTNENWWHSENGFLFVVSEYFKLFFYHIRYGWLGYEIVAAVVVLIFLVAVLVFFRAWFVWRRKLIHSGVDGKRDNPAQSL